MTRLTSTPLSPTRSKAEACQPLRAVYAAWHGYDHGAGSPWRRPVGDVEAVSPSFDSDNAPDCPVNAFIRGLLVSGYGLPSSSVSGVLRGVYGRLEADMAESPCNRTRVMSASASRRPHPGPQGYQAPGHSPRRQSGEAGDWRTDPSPSPFSPVETLGEVSSPRP